MYKKEIFKFNNSENEFSVEYSPGLFSQGNDYDSIDISNHSKINQSGIQHIGFKLKNDEFLLPMTMVREIVMLPLITYVPHTSPTIEGVIALRGEIMPVINLRRFLGMQRGFATPSTRVIILECKEGGFGVIVDEITEFVWLQPNNIEAIEQNFFGSEYKILSGVAKVGTNMRGIIDVLKLVKHIARIEEGPTEDEVLEG